jgi:hypothetical protein
MLRDLVLEISKLKLRLLCHVALDPLFLRSSHFPQLELQFGIKIGPTLVYLGGSLLKLEFPTLHSLNLSGALFQELAKLR